MRTSPLLHPLAVLRIAAGLTQKEMGALVNRAARTIQSIELRKLPLTEELALRIAEATGVDEAWLFAGDPKTAPRKGLTLIQAGKGEGDYTRADYEYHRAYKETPVVMPDVWNAAKERAIAAGTTKIDVPALGLKKVEVLNRQMELIDLIDLDLRNHLTFILAKTCTTDDMRLVRWKIRRFLEDLAKEFSLKLVPSDISIKILAWANPKPPADAKAAEPAPSIKQRQTSSIGGKSIPNKGRRS